MTLLKTNSDNLHSYKTDIGSLSAKSTQNNKMSIQERKEKGDINIENGLMLNKLLTHIC